MAQYGTAMYLGDTLIEQSFLGANQSLPFFSVTQYPYVTSGSVMILDAAIYTTGSSTWYDVSGNSNNATLTNMIPFYTRGTTGSYFDFPFNSADYMVVTQAASLNNAFIGDFTIDFWATIDAKAGGGNDFVTVVSKPSIAGDWGNLINRSGGGADGTVKFYLQNSDKGNPAGNIGYTTGSFFNLQLVRSGTTMTMYANTNSIGSIAVSGSGYGTNDLYIGKQNNNTYLMDGKIGWIGIYNRALDSTERAQNYNAIKVRYGY